MTRKLALLLAACLGLWHGSAWALGLGEIEVRSALNERFSAAIDLRRVEELSQNEIIASLASSEDFSRLGVQRFFYLSELEFTTDVSDPSRPKILISSNRPINEPFVHFVVDVRWPTGRMLREYTVLLDPPAYAERPMPSMRPAETAAPARTDRGQVRTEAQTSSAAAPDAGRFDGDSYGVTDRDDTLWAIALQVRPSSDVSVQQTMLALQRLNPDAFIRGNINLLKAGYILEVPSADEIARLSRQDAVVQVAGHNARWRDGTPAMPVDARPEVAVGDSGSRPAGELRLVAGEDDDVRVTRDATPAGTGGGDAAEALRGDLAAAESRLSEAEAARVAAEQQREEAASELEQLNRQLELRNQELARLQRQLAEQQSSPEAAPRPASAASPGTSWTLIAAGLVGLIIIVAAVLLLLRRRRAQGDDDLAAEVEEVQGVSKPIQETQLMSAISKEDLARAGIGAGAAGAAAAAAGDDESDVIAEADVYMAYGRFSEAARVLNSAIDADGQRADLRLKLMEVLVETQDVESFNAQAQSLRGFADEQTIALADDLASRLPGAVTSTGATSQGESAGPVRAADEGEVSLDFDLGDDFGEPADLDSLDIDFDASNEPKPVAPALPDADDDDDLTLLLDGEDDAAAVDTASTEADSNAAADAGDELDLDFDFDAPKEASPSAADEQGDALDLALDLGGADSSLDETLDLDDGVAAARDAKALEPSGETDFDFDLPAEDESATGGPLGEGDEDVTLLDAPAKAEQADGDPDFDLTMDGSGFVEKPGVTAPAADDEDDIDGLDFDLASGGADTAGGEKLSALESGTPSATADAAEDDDDLSFDFDIEDLPAAGSDGEAKAEEDLSATVSRDPADDDSDDDGSEDITELRFAAGDANDGDEDITEFSLEGFEDDSETAAPASAPASTEAGELPVDLADDDLEFGMDFDEAGDETTTKLELARAYIDMGDEDGAKEILDEVVRDGNDTQQQEAAELLARLG